MISQYRFRDCIFRIWVVKVFGSFSWRNLIFIWVTWTHCKHSTIKSKFNFPLPSPTAHICSFHGISHSVNNITIHLGIDARNSETLLPSLSHILEALSCQIRSMYSRNLFLEVVALFPFPLLLCQLGLQSSPHRFSEKNVLIGFNIFL